MNDFIRDRIAEAKALNRKEVRVTDKLTKKDLTAIEKCGYTVTIRERNDTLHGYITIDIGW